ncbi:MAG TPA: class I SAM-dependent methyltransferase [Thermoleophilaceae bacterium]
MSASGALADVVVWHDVECGGYDADLPLWRELAGDAAGPVLELGCGTGRVALDLASRGHDVTALDSDPALVRELDARARERGVRVETAVADARTFSLEGRYALIVAPMQVAQLMGGDSGRAGLLRSARAHLARGGVFAAALADPFEGLPAADTGPPVPDVRERDGWVYSSTPVAVRSAPGGGTAIDRLRQAVSPAGDLDESMWSITLDALEADELERQAGDWGFEPLARRGVPPTGDYVGSVVVVLEGV